MADHKKLELLAWIGEDELGSGEIGIKGALTPVGFIPIVMTGDKLDKMTQKAVVSQLRQIVRIYGKTIRLCRFTYVEELMTLD